LQDTFELSGFGVLLEEFEILTDEPVREAGGDADLVDGEAFLVEQDNTSEVLDVALDSSLRVVGSTLDVREIGRAHV
jgi:hypothetical protein